MISGNGQENTEKSTGLPVKVKLILIKINYHNTIN